MFRRLVRSRDYLAEHVHEPLTLADAAREAYLSPYHYHRVFRATFGETPHEFVTRIKMEQAKKLLLRDGLTVTDVCFALGFESLGSFSSRFRNVIGYSPSEYQRNLRSVFKIPQLAPYRLVPNCFLAFHGIRHL